MASARGVKPTKRDRLRTQGLRPIEIWVPDVRASSFRAEAHRQSAAVAKSVYAAEDQAFIDAVSEGTMNEAGRHLDRVGGKNYAG